MGSPEGIEHGQGASRQEVGRGAITQGDGGGEAREEAIAGREGRDHGNLNPGDYIDIDLVIGWEIPPKEKASQLQLRAH